MPTTSATRPVWRSCCASTACTPETIAFLASGGNFTDTGPTVAVSTGIVLSEKTSTAATEIFVNGVGDGSFALSGTLQCQARPGFRSAAIDGRFYGSANYQGVLSDADHSSLVSFLTAKLPSVDVTVAGQIVNAPPYPAADLA
jgi:hypothetical protein